MSNRRRAYLKSAVAGSVAGFAGGTGTSMAWSDETDDSDGGLDLVIIEVIGFKYDDTKPTNIRPLSPSG